MRRLRIIRRRRRTTSLHLSSPDQIHALIELLIASRALVDKQPGNPEYEGLRNALTFYEGYGMGQTGVPTSAEIADKICRLRDEQGLTWTIIAERFDIKSETARKVYHNRKAELAGEPPTDNNES